METFLTDYSSNILTDFLQERGVELSNYIDVEKLDEENDNQFKIIHDFLINFKKSFDLAVLDKNFSTREQILKDGAKIVFLLREFLTKKQIYVLVGGTRKSRGKNATTYLAEQEISQKELFDNFDINTTAVILGNGLENLKKLTKVKDENILDQWNKILELSDISGDYGKKTDKYIDDSNNEDSRLFQKSSPDIKIYFRYATVKNSTKRNRYRYYCGLKEQFFNDGWLYEWYKSYITNATIKKQTELIKSLKNNSIQPIIQRMDNIPGYKGGDFFEKTKDDKGKEIYKWYQAKYGNQQIITFKSIQEVLEQCIEAFNPETLKQKRKQILKDLFIQAGDKGVPKQLIQEEIQALNEALVKLNKV